MRFNTLAVLLTALVYTASARKSYYWGTSQVDYLETTPIAFFYEDTAAYKDYDDMVTGSPLTSLGLPNGYEWLEAELSMLGNGWSAPELSEEQWIELQAVMSDEKFDQLVELYAGNWIPEDLSTPFELLEDTTNKLVIEDSSTPPLPAWWDWELLTTTMFPGDEDESGEEMGESEYSEYTTPIIEDFPAMRDNNSRYLQPKYNADDLLPLIGDNSFNYDPFRYYRRHRALVIALPIGGVVALLLIIVGVVCICRKKRRDRGDYSRFSSAESMVTDDEKKVPL